MVMMVREHMQGDMGGKGPKTRNDNKAGFKLKDDSKKKYGKEGRKKDAEEKPRSPWHSH